MMDTKKILYFHVVKKNYRGSFLHCPMIQSVSIIW